jgi:hypothetical protein
VEHVEKGLASAIPNPCTALAAGTADNPKKDSSRKKGFVPAGAISMLMMKERRAAIRTLQGWATSVLLEAGAILECEEHSWLKERTDPDAWARPCRRSAGSAARRLAGGVGDARCRRVELFGFRPIQPSPAFVMESSSLETSRRRPDTGSRSLAISNPRRTIMVIQIVMDRTGDSRHRFDANDTQELAKAEQRFYELTKVGFTAAVRTGAGQVSQIRSFDPNAEETVFFPRLVGG